MELSNFKTRNGFFLGLLCNLKGIFDQKNILDRKNVDFRAAGVFRSTAALGTTTFQRVHVGRQAGFRCYFEGR